MKSIKLYFIGVWKALKGEYPHEAQEQLTRIRVMAKRDARVFTNVPIVIDILDRYEALSSKDWKTTYLLPRGLIVLRYKHLLAKYKDIFKNEQKETSPPDTYYHPTIPPVPVDGEEHSYH